MSFFYNRLNDRNFADASTNDPKQSWQSQQIHAESADLASLQIRYSRLRNSQHLYLPIRLRPAQRLVAVTTNSVDVTSRISARNLKSLALPKAASNPA